MNNKTCCKCKSKSDNLHYVNFMHNYICNDCYKDWMKKEENYYDYCVAREIDYQRKVQLEFNKEKFFKD